jgi:hypothetical protein
MDNIPDQLVESLTQTYGVHYRSTDDQPTPIVTRSTSCSDVAVSTLPRISERHPYNMLLCWTDLSKIGYMTILVYHLRVTRQVQPIPVAVQSKGACTECFASPLWSLNIDTKYLRSGKTELTASSGWHGFHKDLFKCNWVRDPSLIQSTLIRSCLQFSVQSVKNCKLKTFHN